MQFVPDRLWPHHVFGKPLKRPDMTSIFVPRAKSDTSDAEEPGSGSSFEGTPIEDYSRHHDALARFFGKLRDTESLGRPVHVAFMGDSFIEGDILVADFRTYMQGKYGGGGVGFVPVSSNVDQYRSTVRMKSEGWKTWSVLSDRTHRYTLPFTMFEAEKSDPAIRVSTTKRYRDLWSSSVVSLISEGGLGSSVTLETGGKDSLTVHLGSESTMVSTRIADNLGKFRLRFADAEGIKVLGLTLDDVAGVSVDNFSLRGNSGLILQAMDSAECSAFNQIRPYDLIILEYGLNVASDSVRDYDWYAKGMENSVEHVRKCFPDADILLLGISDRGHMTGEGIATMPAVPALVAAQKKCARATGIAFWDTYRAMGGRNSMVKWVKWKWAAEDYTHIGFKGGRILAGKLSDAFDHEYEYYESGVRK
jgi:hypothetical protein